MSDINFNKKNGCVHQLMQRPGDLTSFSEKSRAKTRRGKKIAAGPVEINLGSLVIRSSIYGTSSAKAVLAETSSIYGLMGLPDGSPLWCLSGLTVLLVYPMHRC